MNNWLDDIAQTKNAEWHEWRRKHIGASEIAAVLGESDFQSAYDLWQVKTGKKQPFAGNFVTERGQQAEPIIRKVYEEIIGRELCQPGALEWNEWPILSATLDGWDEEEKCPVEIKYLSEKKFKEVKETGQVPKTYRAQLQQQIFVSGARHSVFVCASQSNDIESIGASNVIYFRVARDEEYCKRIEQAAREFWGKVESGKWTDPAVEDAELCGWLEEIEVQKQKIESAEKRIEELRDKVKAQIDENGKEVVGWIISWKQRKGNVTYKNIPELNGVDLEKYRAPPIKFLDIRRTTKDE